MSVTFNATVSNGLVITPDNSGQIQFQLNGVNVPSPSVAPTFSAYQGSTQSLSASTATKIIINTKEWDTNNNFDAVTNYRFTPTVAGYYQFSFAIRSDNTLSALHAKLYKNGVDTNKDAQFTNSSLSAFMSSSSALLYLNGTTDYVELYAFSGSAITLNPSYCYLQAFLARPA